MKYLCLLLLSLLPWYSLAQASSPEISDASLRAILHLHKELVSIPNLPENKKVMVKNIHWVAEKYKQLNFKTTLLESSTLPVLLAEKVYDPQFKTILFYFHIDGQPINPAAWNQRDPFVPVLKERSKNGDWQPIDWSKLDGAIDDEWRVFARAAADDKAPIIMFLAALDMLKSSNRTPNFNIKVIFDPEEEYGSQALFSTLDQYKKRYASDYFIVMDGPAHSSNKPTLTFGCRGIATCSITTYGAKRPQHSGHFGNYVANPVFSLSRLLAGMKDEKGRVTIEDYYAGIEITDQISQLINSLPFDSTAFNHQLCIHSAEEVGGNYQEALQYPSLNVRQIGTSWKGEKLKTVIPAYARADIDVRLVPEIEGTLQLQKIKNHIQEQGYHVIDRDPTDDERLRHPRIAKFQTSRVINAFRTDPDFDFGKQIRTQLTRSFGYQPVVLRMMGGTVPIVPLIDQLNVPTIIVPMVNMDNNQHSPNENIRIGNIREGISICLAILNMEL